MDNATDVFQTIDKQCLRCIHYQSSNIGCCEFLAVGLRKIVGIDSTWVVCDDFTPDKRREPQ